MTDGVESAIRQARTAAAGGAVTVVGGVSVVQQLIAAGLVDELRLDLQPVFLGRGLRFLDDVSPDVRLEKLTVIEVGSRTSLRYRVLKERSGGAKFSRDPSWRT